jgi:hypothetical protein
VEFPKLRAASASSFALRRSALKVRKNSFSSDKLQRIERFIAAESDSLKFDATGAGFFGNSFHTTIANAPAPQINPHRNAIICGSADKLNCVAGLD